MSFYHWTSVGYFDPESIYRIGGEKDMSVSKNIDKESIKLMLSEYPTEIKNYISYQEGYLRCQWAPVPSKLGEKIQDFAYRLAKLNNCLAVENDREVKYPPEAVLKQRESWERFLKNSQ